MLIGMHMCRGNFKSTWVAEGAYDPAADAIFNQTGVDIYFMEYDTDRAGGLEPLRLLPKGKKRVMPGFITTKTAELEKLDDLKRKFEEASKYADLDQLGIAPQCGFASTEEGNAITEDDQKRKLELVVKTAEAVWGGVYAIYSSLRRRKSTLTGLSSTLWPGLQTPPPAGGKTPARRWLGAASVSCASLMKLRLPRVRIAAGHEQRSSRISVLQCAPACSNSPRQAARALTLS